MTPFKYDNQKAIAAILYISTKVDGVKFHKLFKILYFADLKHIAKYGRPIVGDRYVAMEAGPVPSKIYDILKEVKKFFSKSRFSKFFEVNIFSTVSPKQQPDTDLFSDSDIECLDESIKENQGLSWSKLKDKSHDEAWKKAWDVACIKQKKQEDIDLNDIILVSGANEDMRQYIANRHQKYKVA